MWSTWWLNISNINGNQLVAGAFFTVVFAVLWLRLSTKISSQLPPGPRGLPLIGYIPFLTSDLHLEFFKLATLYGPIYKLWFANQLTIVINSPSLIKEVVRDQDIIFANRDTTVSARIMSFGGHDIAFSPYGSEWKKLRKIFVREILNNSVLDSLYSLRKDEVKNTIKRVYGNKGKPVDVGELAFLTAMNSVTRMLCGTASLQGEKGVLDGARFKETAAELMVLLGKPNVSDIFPALAWLDLQGVGRDTRRVTRVFEVMFDHVMEQRKKEKTTRNDLLQCLLELHESQDSQRSISMEQLKALLMNIVLGGTDTTSTMVEWAMAELLKNPEAMTKVQEEVTQVVGSNNSLEEFHLPKLAYLEAVIKETFRLHPALPLLAPRCPTQSTTIGGYKIPKGSRIFLNVGVVQKDPSIWENPLEFRPERFLMNNASSFDLAGNNLNFLPFGSGRRLCPGIPLADRMLKYVMASFLHLFDWKLPAGAKIDLSDKFGIVVKKKERVVAIPTPRFDNLELYL
ncbi:hypothetical protein UlMin_001253 [Ulmus minor]